MDVMLDLETLGNKPNSAIIQIAAIDFNKSTGEILHEFKINVDIDSNLEYRLHVDGDTVKWWLNQSDEARSSIMEHGYDLDIAIKSFIQFIKNIQPDRENVYIWTHASFDEPILRNAMYKVGAKNVPWSYRNVRDLRTLVDLAQIDPKTYKQQGTAHDALDDCKFQIQYTVDALKKVGIC